MKINIQPVRSYASEKNVEKAVAKFKAFEGLRYFIMKTEENRYFPVFIGEVALQNGVHFHFNVIG